MTDTDLITADGSSDDVDLSNPVNSPTVEAVSQAPAEPAAAPAQASTVVASGDRPTSLTAMVLPDLRALAGQLGVKGSSGMRKSELIAAIREHRGDANGAAAAAPAAEQATAEPAAAPPRRERRSASRNAGAAAAAEAKTSGEPAAQQNTDATGAEATATEPAPEAKATKAGSS